jgi:peroxiredoxin
LSVYSNSTGDDDVYSFLLTLLLSFLLTGSGLFPHTNSTPPAVGEKAPDFSLSTSEGKQVRLSEETAQAPVVLVVLRGYPGYQCPLCNQQAHDFLKNSRGFADARVRVILVYPGPPENLDSRASEFLTDKKLPSHFSLLLDPDYQFTNLYGLRWDAPNETAYPSTFLIDRKRIIFFAKTSKTHGGRAKAVELLEILSKNK